MNSSGEGLIVEGLNGQNPSAGGPSGKNPNGGCKPGCSFRDVEVFFVPTSTGLWVRTWISHLGSIAPSPYTERCIVKKKVPKATSAPWQNFQISLPKME